MTFIVIYCHSTLFEMGNLFCKRPKGPNQKDMITIFIQSFGKTVDSVEMRISDTVADLKCKILDTIGVPLEQQNLYNDKVLLTDERLISSLSLSYDSAVQWCSYVDLILKLKL